LQAKAALPRHEPNRRATFGNVQPLLRAWSIALLLVAPSLLGAERRVDVSPPATLVAGDPAIVAESPGARGDRLLRAALVFDYTRAPLALVSSNQDVHLVVEDQLWAHALASFAVSHRWLVALELPVLLRETGERQSFAPELAPASQGMAVGDPRLTLRGRLWGSPDGLALGLGVRASAPLATRAYAGSPGPVISPFLALGHQALTTFSAFNVGFEWRQNQTLPGILPTRVGTALQLAMATGFTLDSAHSTRLGPEVAVNMTIGNGARLLDAQSTVCELLVHLQHRLLGGPFEIGAAFGPAIGRAPGAADYRALLSIVFSPEEVAPPPDSDDDRVPDDADMCPSLRGEASEDPLMHGCPPVPPDADGDGMPDTIDACPRTPGEPSIVRKRHGCPKPRDRDQDSIVDADDACPDQAGVESNDAQRRGCPPPRPKVALEQSQIAITEQVQFETGTAVIRDDSAELLQQVVNLLQSHPEVQSCEVAGHTDDTGQPELNRQLSEARARAVMSWLVARGVDSQRLSARGYGEARPIADNTSEEGRARNRRVEFLILRRAAPEAPR
jgi:OmpA-OmpF porin, OOP family